ncbi:MAG TPA: adenylyltransferase/cytidyltransferase family protein [Spirochaetia bacterium]|nr:adenylyltransferase/cytidyltransferase family protein [Spirochaetia bacterium]
MRRAVLLSGWGSVPTGLSMKEYVLIAVRRLPAGRGTRAWERLAEDLDLELSASWLLLRPGEREPSDEVKARLQGCRPSVEDGALRQALRGIDAAASRSRIVTDFSTVQKRCEALRKSGRRLVFTNGVFDLFHLGHLRLLQSARALGDALVVGINSDESARQLKGHERPIVPQFARAEIVAGTRTAALCVIFPQADPRELLRAVRPDILVKGSEYSLSGVVGRELVERGGGAVARVPHVPGWSTSEIIRRIRSSG